MKIFLTQFIGSSNKDCIIINPEVINFTYRKATKTLEAKVNQPLIIHNKKLGYKITYFLSAFSHSPIPTWYPTETSYKGNYVFAEDTAGLTPTEVKEILQARDKAYYGSRMHFIRSVWTHDLDNNKFIYHHYSHNNDYARVLFIFNNIRANKEEILNSTIIKNLNGEKDRSPFPCMYIMYNGGFEPYKNDWSYVTFQSGTEDVPITPISYNESNLIWSGKMAMQRVGELLPLDFEPSELLSETK